MKDGYMDRICEKPTPTIKRHCVICGNFFTPPKAIKYKCDACAGVAYIETFSAEKKRFCSACGKVFTVKDERRYYCSDECKRKQKNKSAEDAPKKPTTRKKKMSAAEIARKAREEGLNYGQYVAMHGL